MVPRHGIVTAVVTTAVAAGLSWWGAAALVRAGLAVTPTWAFLAMGLTLAGEAAGIIALGDVAPRASGTAEDAQRLIVRR